MSGEYESPVPPLTAPHPGERSDLASLAANDAVALFAQRARATNPDFVLTAANAAGRWQAGGFWRATAPTGVAVVAVVPAGSPLLNVVCLVLFGNALRDELERAAGHLACDDRARRMRGATPVSWRDARRLDRRFYTVTAIASLLTLARFSEGFLILRGFDDDIRAFGHTASRSLPPHRGHGP